MTENLNYNDYGLAIGLISYSFKTNGKTLFEQVFKNDLFKNHVKNLMQFTRDRELIDPSLYKPAGYRLFGNHGIAVLSLMDDYAFCNRIFNNNHTHKDNDRWHGKIITGVGSRENYLYEKARQTFLKESNRYPFIGITKLKVDYRLLYGIGINYTEYVKQAIERLHKGHSDFSCVEYFVVDCFDNDEMAVVAFSTSLQSISGFMEKIRGLEHHDVVSLVSEDERQKFAPNKDKHVFTSCHINLGYDVDYTIEKKAVDETHNCNKADSNTVPTFLPVNSKDLVADKYLNFICEAKPGHTVELQIQIKDYFKVHDIPQHKYTINTSITGGSVIHIVLPTRYIGVIENMCLHTDCQKHMCRVKISLRNAKEKEDENMMSNITNRHEQLQTQNEQLFDSNFLEGMKKRLNKCGVSKSVRERLLSLYHLYNDSVGNLLHSAYFEELKGALLREQTVLDDFLADETKTIKSMDDDLSTHIALFEEAFYNRFHEKGLSHSNNLEYNGSVQQYLTSFDTLYKQLYRVIVPDRNNNASLSADGVPLTVPAEFQTAFVSITGHERVSSTRRNLQLNINQITYPEFFATTVWKELANHCKPLLDNIPISNEDAKDAVVRLKLWKNFVTRQDAFQKIRFFLDKKMLASHIDEVYKTIHNRLDSELMAYFMNDQIVFHFGFQRNFELFWHFYWKTFLQTSRMFSRKGEIKMELFVDMLLRLIIVRESCSGNLSKQEQCKYDKFVTEQQNPYDSSMSGLWQACYDKVCDCAHSIFDTIEAYGFSAACQEVIYWLETRLADMMPYLKNKHLILDLIYNDNVTNKNLEIIDMRREVTEAIRRELTKREVVEPGDEFLSADGTLSPYYALCLLPAYLKEIMTLDFKDKHDAVIKSVPRDENGEKLCFSDGNGEKRSFVKDTEITDHMLNMLADPLGGVLITGFDIRKDYFSMRTTLYRNLWNYKMLTEKPL